MDPAIAALAASGAQAIVGLMATDAWERAKGLAARVFAGRHRDATDLMVSDLDESRNEVAGAIGEDRYSVCRHQQDLWDARLRIALLGDPQIAHSIYELLDLAERKGLLAQNSQNISMHANAADQSRVYQQGQGIQYNG
ncbi:hypothetical protein [Micromonospora sp. BL4]|uniref:hypothetical protein n=1 Tax=Micromonospora sp. BL4 TaxID=2478710 RepID=UPI0011C38175|nr:hypothetical protein [Micromonospora sp. BL4]